MKYIKLFEELNIGEPEIGDWVICQTSQDDDKLLKEYLSTAIGKFQKISGRIYFNYEIYFEDMPKDLENIWDNPIEFMRKEIKYWSKNKEDLELIIQSKKYNL